MPSLNWIGKEAVINHHRQVPYHLLRCDNSLSCGDPDSGNLLVEGDNLLALKALLPYYAGQVKCIYIDPPYNTGNEKWKYNDNVNSPKMRKWLGKVVGAEGEDLSRHDKWLCMMYPRLKLLMDLLSDDGVIFVSIDDNEQHHLRILLDDIFGERNRVDRGCIIWNNAGSTRGFRRIVKNHEYILAYAKQQELVDSLYALNFPKELGIINERLQIKRSPRNPLAQVKFPKGLKIEGVKNKVFRDYIGGYGTNKIDIINKNMIFKDGKLVNDVVLQASFPYKNQMIEFFSKIGTEEKTYDFKGQEWIEVYFRKNGVPYYKKRRNVVILGSVLKELPNSGSPDMEKLNMKNAFDNPKPVKLIKELISYFTTGEDIILDSFAGSGTTGHAVLDLNKEDNGNRKFILVEMEPDICNKITYNRLKSAINGYTYNQNNVEPLGGGFRYCRLDKPLFDETGKIGETVKFADLSAHVFFTETGMPIPKRTNGKSPFLGTANGTGYYLLFNGILGDKTPDGGNVLTGKVLANLPKHNGPKVIFGEGCRLGSARLKREQITFKQLPYEIKVS